MARTFDAFSTFPKCSSGPRWPAAAHPANTSSKYLFLSVSEKDGNYTHFCLVILKPIRSSEAQSPVEKNSCPSISWEKPPGQTSCLSVMANQVIWEGRWFEWAQMFHFKPQPAITLEPFLFCSHFFSCHRNIQKRSRETACPKRWQLQMALNSKHDNNLSHLTQCYNKGSCRAASRCQLTGSVWRAQWRQVTMQFEKGF